MASESVVNYSGPVVSKKEAKALGLKHYFTGIPCKHGHVALRYVSCGACVPCGHAATKKWDIEHRDVINERARIYREANPEKVREAGRKHDFANREKRAQQAREYRKRNPAKANGSCLKWAQNNPDKANARTQRRRALRVEAEGFYTVEDLTRIRKAQRGKCAYCRKPLHGKGHVDHIKALSKGGTNWPNNIQLVCLSCNSKKNNSDPIDFAKKTGRLL